MVTQFALPKSIVDIHNHVKAEDARGDQLVAQMDAAGVETALIMGSPMNSNEHAAEAVAAHPGRFVGGAYLDPRAPDACEQMDHWVRRGLRIVKLFPNFGYYPDDEAYRPFFAKAASLGLAVLSHCGWLTPAFGPTAAYFSYPGRFELIARTFGDMPFIFAHMGGIGGFLEAIMLATRAPNVYLDVSPGQGIWVLEHAGAMAASVPAEKLLWGADTYEQAELLQRSAKALTAMGMADSFEKIYSANARTVLQKAGAIKQG